MGISRRIDKLKPVIMMAMVQVSSAGVNIFYKLAANDGMSLRVFIAYRSLFATAFVVPLALLVERNRRPKLTRVVACQAFLCALLGGTIGQNLYSQSLVFTSATFASALSNLIPAMTFILAVTFGLERLELGTIGGKAKVVGTSMCIGGAMLMSFYKGPTLNIWSTKVDLLHMWQHRGGHVATSHHDSYWLGVLLAVCSCLAGAAALTIQAKMLRVYPCPYSTNALMTIMGSIQAVAFALCMDRSDWRRWRLGWNIRLFTVSFSGIVASGIMFTFVARCVQARGPLYVSVFKPLTLVLVAIAGSLLLQEKLHLGSLVGAVVIVCGLYVVLWGKGKELSPINSQLMQPKSSGDSQHVNIAITSSPENNNNSTESVSSK